MGLLCCCVPGMGNGLVEKVHNELILITNKGTRICTDARFE